MGEGDERRKQLWTKMLALFGLKADMMAAVRLAHLPFDAHGDPRFPQDNEKSVKAILNVVGTTGL